MSNGNGQTAFRGWVYIMANRRYGTLYVGVTSDLARRIHLHRTEEIPGFTSRYGVTRLVWYEHHATMPLAIEQEKRIKRWRRRWKFDLIEGINPGWEDLFDRLNV